MCRLNDVRYSNLTNSFEFKLNVERGILTRIVILANLRLRLSQGYLLQKEFNQWKLVSIKSIFCQKKNTVIGRERRKIEVGNSLKVRLTEMAQ